MPRHMRGRMELRIRNRFEIKTESDACKNAGVKVGFANDSKVCYDMIIIYWHQSLRLRHLDAEELNKRLKSKITQ
jgi:hypothetical protein